MTSSTKKPSRLKSAKANQDSGTKARASSKPTLKRPSKSGSEKAEKVVVHEPEIISEEIQPEATELKEADDLAQELARDVSPNFPSDEKNAKALSTWTGGSLPATADPLTAYLAEIRKYPLLTPEEERDLAVQYREKGDRAAAEKLVTANLRFVVKIAAEYSKFGAKMIDLIQEGNVGLMQAVKDFNPYRGVRLITYAVWWIRGYIREYLMRQYSLVRVGTTHNQKKLFYNLQQEEQRLESLGYEVDSSVLSQALGVTEEDVETMQQRMRGRDISLDQPLDDGSRTTLMDLQRTDEAENPEDQLLRNQEIQRLKEKISLIRPDLNSKELYILENRILADEAMTLQEIGDHMGITRERARQIESRVLEKIKAALLGETKA